MIEAARLARGLAAPIYTKTLGGDVELRDLALGLESQQELAFIGQKTPLLAAVRRRGLGTPQATVVLSGQGRELERRVGSIRREWTSGGSVRRAAAQPGPLSV